jgi:hypothetical protein
MAWSSSRGSGTAKSRAIHAWEIHVICNIQVPKERVTQEQPAKRISGITILLQTVLACMPRPHPSVSTRWTRTIEEPLAHRSPRAGTKAHSLLHDSTGRRSRGRLARTSCGVLAH